MQRGMTRSPGRVILLIPSQFPATQFFFPVRGFPVPRVEPAEVAERGFPAFLPVTVQEKTFHPSSPVYGRIKRGAGALVLKSFCIMPGPERRGGCVGIVPRHQLGSVEGEPEFVKPFMNGSPGLTDVHEEIFSHRPDTIEPGFSRDISKFESVSGKRDPRGPGETLPSGREKVHEYQARGDDFFFRVTTSAGTLRTCIFLWQLGQSATVFSMTSNPPFESQSI